MNRNELCHHGVKGQRWGVRRFQNQDGTLTSAGRKRYAANVSDEEKQKIVKEAALDKAYRKAISPNKDRLEKIKNAVDQTNRLAENAQRTNAEQMRKRVHKEKLDLSKMTDQEMRTKINRALLEQQYTNMFAKDISTVSKGQKAVDNALKVGGTVLTAGSTALSIALMIKELKK